MLAGRDDTDLEETPGLPSHGGTPSSSSSSLAQRPSIKPLAPDTDLGNVRLSRSVPRRHTDVAINRHHYEFSMMRANVEERAARAGRRRLLEKRKAEAASALGGLDNLRKTRRASQAVASQAVHDSKNHHVFLSAMSCPGLASREVRAFNAKPDHSLLQDEKGDFDYCVPEEMQNWSVAQKCQREINEALERKHENLEAFVEGMSMRMKEEDFRHSPSSLPTLLNGTTLSRHQPGTDFGSVDRFLPIPGSTPQGQTLQLVYVPNSAIDVDQSTPGDRSNPTPSQAVRICVDNHDNGSFLSLANTLDEHFRLRRPTQSANIGQHTTTHSLDPSRPLNKTISKTSSFGSRHLPSAAPPSLICSTPGPGDYDVASALDKLSNFGRNTQGGVDLGNTLPRGDIFATPNTRAAYASTSSYDSAANHLAIAQLKQGAVTSNSDPSPTSGHSNTLLSNPNVYLSPLTYRPNLDFGKPKHVTHKFGQSPGHSGPVDIHSGSSIPVVYGVRSIGKEPLSSRSSAGANLLGFASIIHVPKDNSPGPGTYRSPNAINPNVWSVFPTPPSVVISLESASQEGLVSSVSSLTGGRHLYHSASSHTAYSLPSRHLRDSDFTNPALSKAPTISTVPREAALTLDQLKSGSGGIVNKTLQALSLAMKVSTTAAVQALHSTQGGGQERTGVGLTEGGGDQQQSGVEDTKEMDDHSDDQHISLLKMKAAQSFDLTNSSKALSLADVHGNGTLMSELASSPQGEGLGVLMGRPDDVGNSDLDLAHHNSTTHFYQQGVISASSNAAPKASRPRPMVEHTRVYADGLAFIRARPIYQSTDTTDPDSLHVIASTFPSTHSSSSSLLLDRSPVPTSPPLTETHTSAKGMSSLPPPFSPTLGKRSSIPRHGPSPIHSGDSMVNSKASDDLPGLSSSIRSPEATFPSASAQPSNQHARSTMSSGEPSIRPHSLGKLEIRSECNSRRPVSSEPPLYSPSSQDPPVKKRVSRFVSGMSLRATAQQLTASKVQLPPAIESALGLCDIHDSESVRRVHKLNAGPVEPACPLNTMAQTKRQIVDRSASATRPSSPSWHQALHSTPRQLRQHVVLQKDHTQPNNFQTRMDLRKHHANVIRERHRADAKRSEIKRIQQWIIVTTAVCFAQSIHAKAVEMESTRKEQAATLILQVMRRNWVSKQQYRRRQLEIKAALLRVGRSFQAWVMRVRHRLRQRAAATLLRFIDEAKPGTLTLFSIARKVRWNVMKIQRWWRHRRTLIHSQFTLLLRQWYTEKTVLEKAHQEFLHWLETGSHHIAPLSEILRSRYEMFMRSELERERKYDSHGPRRSSLCLCPNDVQRDSGQDLEMSSNNTAMPSIVPPNLGSFNEPKPSLPQRSLASSNYTPYLPSTHLPSIRSPLSAPIVASIASMSPSDLFNTNQRFSHSTAHGKLHPQTYELRALITMRQCHCTVAHPTTAVLDLGPRSVSSATEDANGVGGVITGAAPPLSRTNCSYGCGDDMDMGMPFESYDHGKDRLATGIIYKAMRRAVQSSQHLVNLKLQRHHTDVQADPIPSGTSYTSTSPLDGAEAGSSSLVATPPVAIFLPKSASLHRPVEQVAAVPIGGLAQEIVLRILRMYFLAARREFALALRHHFRCIKTQMSDPQGGLFRICHLAPLTATNSQRQSSNRRIEALVTAEFELQHPRPKWRRILPHKILQTLVLKAYVQQSHANLRARAFVSAKALFSQTSLSSSPGFGFTDTSATPSLSTASLSASIAALSAPTATSSAKSKPHARRSSLALDSILSASASRSPFGSLLLQSPRIDVADVRGIFPAVPEQPRSIVRLPLIIKEVPVAVENRSSSSRPTCKQPNHLPVRLNPLARKPLTRHGKSFSP